MSHVLCFATNETVAEVSMRRLKPNSVVKKAFLVVWLLYFCVYTSHNCLVCYLKLHYCDLTNEVVSEQCLGPI